jgi:hypothetical protein
MLQVWIEVGAKECPPYEGGQAAEGGRGSSSPLTEVVPTPARTFRSTRPPARAMLALVPLRKGDNDAGRDISERQ